MYIYSVLFVLYIYKQFNVHPKLRIANVLLLKFGGGVLSISWDTFESWTGSPIVWYNINRIQRKWMFTLKKKNTVKTKENESKGQKKKDLKKRHWNQIGLVLNQQILPVLFWKMIDSKDIRLKYKWIVCFRISWPMPEDFIDDLLYSNHFDFTF